MLDEIMEFLDLRALAIAAVLSMLFIGMIWGLEDVWGDYSITNKIAISIFFPPIAYFIAYFGVNK